MLFVHEKDTRFLGVVSSFVGLSRTDVDLIAPTRARLQAAGLPWIMENVPNAPLKNAVVLCGSMFGLGVKRHRLFESSSLLFTAGHCPHNHGGYVTIFGHDIRPRCPGRGKKGPQGSLPVAVGRRAMGIDWMTLAEMSQAISPAYGEYLGKQLLWQLQHEEKGA